MNILDILELLISEVQVYPILWNKASSEYKETHKKTSKTQKLFVFSIFIFSRTKQAIARIVPEKAPSFMLALLQKRPKQNFARKQTYFALNVN